jgi:N-acetylmuramoyl-L-alanine amidase
MRTLFIGLCIAALFIIFSITIEIKQERPIEISYSRMIPLAKVQIDCLAENIYYEAGNQDRDGQLAIALVTMNRVKHGFSNSICSVVKQKTDKICQFSWKCEQHSKPDPHLYNRVREVALYTYLNYGMIKDITKGATFYHADYVNPGWKNLKKTTKIGKHIFYRAEREQQNDDQTQHDTRWWKPNAKFLLTLDGRS